MQGQNQINDHVVLVSGKSTTGKSFCLRNIRNQNNWIYLCCEAGKKLPFANQFRIMNITDPLQVYEVFTQAEQANNIEGIIIDSITYLMDMYETVHVLSAADTRKAWGNYAQYWKTLMQLYVARSSKKVVMTAHTLDQLNESEMVVETKVPVKGSLKNQGIESYLGIVISTKKISMSDLEKYQNDLLSVSEEEEVMDTKYVFQTRLTKETRNDRIRGPVGLFSLQETYINNDIQLVLDKLDEYYGLQNQQNQEGQVA